MVKQCLSEADYRDILAASGDGPVFLLKHSGTCGISAGADAEFSALAGEPGRAGFWRLVVQQSRDLSALISSETGVRHESPQVLLFRAREVAWAASHGSVTRESMKTALQALDP